MSEKPLVSVITSCHNHEKYLDDYMQGLLSQTYPRIELILFDDGSQDGSWEKIKSYEGRLREKFERVICECHENRGFIKEIDLALGEAKGEFLCLTSSDDTYFPPMVEECVAYLLSHPDVGLVHSDTDYAYENYVEHQHWKSIGKRIPEGAIYEDLLEGNFIMMDSSCVRTELVRRHVDFREYASRNYFFEDYPLCLELSQRTKIGYIDKALARYRVLQESVSHTDDPKKKFRLWKNFFQIKLDFIQRYGTVPGKKEKTEGHFYKGLYRNGYELCLKDECWQGYRWLVQRYPEEFRNYWHFLRALSTHHRALWMLIKNIQEMQLLYRMRQWLLSPLRNWL